MAGDRQHRIVVGVDGSPEAREALRWASRLATARGAEIVAVHALGLLESFFDQLVPAHAHRAQVERQVADDWCGGLRGSGRPFRTVVREGAPVDVLVDVAGEQHAELLVVGSRGIGAAPALALGSTSLHVLQRSPIPVLVVPAPDRAGRHLALRRILAAVDGSPASGPALDAAADLAAAVGAGIEVIHAAEESTVVPRPDRQRLEQLCARARERHVPVHLTVQRGRPDEVVRQRAVDIDADLVVVATRRWGDPAQPLLASVSRRTAGFGHLPTLVVPVAGGQPARRSA